MAAVAALVVGHVMGANAAFALPTDDSEAEGRLLTGNTAAVDLNSIADLAGAYSADPSASGAVNHPLSADVLNALNIDLGDGLQLFGPNGIVGVGALGQYANTAPGAVPLASSGLVNADGSIAVGSGDPTENAYVDLGPILAGAGLDTLLDDARLELGAISGLATYDEAGAPQGDYQIASGTLLLTSPALAALTGEIVDTLDQVSGPINDLAGEGGVIDSTINPLLTPLVDTLNGLLLGIGSIDELGVTATVDLDLEAAVQSALAEPLTSDDSVLTIDLSTGTVSVDLARLVADTQGGDYDGTLNGLPVNTELLDPDLVQATLDGAIGSTLDQIPGLLVEVVTDALHAADVNIAITGEINTLIGLNIGTVDIQLSGTLGDFIGAPGSTPPVVNTDGTSIVGLPVGTLLTPILSTVTGTILPALVTPLANAITDEGTLDTIFRPIVETLNTVLQPLFGLVTNNLLSLTANVQEEPGDFVEESALDDGSFTQRALQLTLLPATATPLLQLSLASATVRAEAAVVADVAITSPTAGEEFPVDTADGTSEVVVTGTGEPGATIEVTIPGIDEPQTTTVDEDGNWEVTFPEVPVGDHTITAEQTVGENDPTTATVDVSVVFEDADATDADATDADATDADATDADATDADATDADATDADATDADATDADATDADATDADATDADATDADATDADATDADATDADATDADATDADATDADATDADATDADATDADATDADATDADATDADATDADATDADATDTDATDADATDADATDADATDADATDADATDADATDADATDADATDADATDADATDADATDADATDADATDADATDADATDADATDADATDADATDADATDATDADATDADATDADATDADATDADATDADATDADATDADATDADATDADATDADATDADATDADATDADATDTDATDTDATDADAADADATDADATDADATDGDVDAGELGITIKHPELEREQTQSSTGTGFQPGEVVTGVMNSEPLALGTQTANAAGTVTFTWTIPAGTDLGAHTVTLTGADSGSVSIDFKVVAKGLAVTGSETGPAIPLALMLIAAGVLAVVGSRRVIKKAQA